MKVLFVCRANAGRSQMAEAFYNSLTNSNDATSAGIELTHSTMGEIMDLPETVLQAMREVGIDLSGKRRKELTPEMLAQADCVAVTVEVPIPEWLVKSSKLIRWNVPDAKGKDLYFHRIVRAQIYELVKKLIDGKKPRNK